jgi:hypothetical protein
MRAIFTEDHHAGQYIGILRHPIGQAGDEHIALGQHVHVDQAAGGWVEHN